MPQQFVFVENWKTYFLLVKKVFVVVERVEDDLDELMFRDRMVLVLQDLVFLSRSGQDCCCIVLLE